MKTNILKDSKDKSFTILKPRQKENILIAWFYAWLIMLIIGLTVSYSAGTIAGIFTSMTIYFVRQKRFPEDVSSEIKPIKPKGV